jgi:hypothetical protein
MHAQAQGHAINAADIQSAQPTKLKRIGPLQNALADRRHNAPLTAGV